MVIPYGRQAIDDDDIQAVIQVLQSDFLTQGPKIKEFEDMVAKYHECKYAVAVSNGTAALHAAYYAAGLCEGDEFITSPITFAASANAGLYLKGKPVFVDINPNTYNIDVDKIEEKITKKTKVITPVSFAGFPADFDKIREIAKKYKLKIIHDAAHAIGARRNGKSIIDCADMTILSFHPVKHIACGEGGMILTNNEEYYKKLLLFRTHGITKERKELNKYDGPWYYEMQELGYNYRLTDIQCALGISQMRKLNDSIYKRNKIAKFYDKNLIKMPWIKVPKYFSREWLDTPLYSNLYKKPDNLCSYHLYPILLPDESTRLKFVEYMRANGIYVQVHYIPLHTMPYYKENFGYNEGDFPEAEAFYKREVSIPMYPTLSEKDLDYILTKIYNFNTHLAEFSHLL